MQTSYFANWRNYDKDKAISIANKLPHWVKMDTYTDLVPPIDLVNAKKYKGLSEEEFEIVYREKVLNTLDAKKVYEDLDGAILLCYEKKGDFCHRHIVAKWLYEELGVIVEEV